jgi:hypothetical protein
MRKQQAVKRQQKIMEVADCDAVTITIDNEIAK